MTITVTQEDREAAASCISGRKAKKEVLGGVWDDSSTVQAFARHRQSAEIAAIEAAKEACAERLRVSPFYTSEDNVKRTCFMTARDTIRALSAHDIMKGVGR